jgi:hypothetical protein
MKKLNTSSTTKQIAEVGSKIIDLNTTHPITEDAYYAQTYLLLSEKTKSLIEESNRGILESDLNEKDTSRDLDIRALFYTVEAYCIRRLSDNQKKAENVKAILDRYGMCITDYSYGDESASVRPMLNDLKNPDLAEDRKSIPDLDALIANLEESQAAFDQAESKLRSQEIERKNSKPAYLLAREIKDIINNDLCGYLEAMTKAMPDKYKSFTEEFAKIIEDNNKKVIDRLAALKRKKEELNIENN